MERQTHHVHTIAGLERKAPSVAKCPGSNRPHSPDCASRKVGTPDSADMPAPDNTTTERAAATRSAACCSWAVMTTAPAEPDEPSQRYIHRPHRITASY